MVHQNIEKPIPDLECPAALKEPASLQEILKTFLECAHKGTSRIEFDKLNKRPLKIRTAFAFHFWQGDLNEIVDYLNIVTGDLVALSERVDLSALELWNRYRLLVRTALNEFYRVKEVSEAFFKELKKLGLIDESHRQALSQIIRDLLKPLADVRNRAIHKHMQVRDEEWGAFGVALFASSGRVIVSSETGQVVEPSSEIGDVAAKIGNELRVTGRELLTSLQRMSDEAARQLLGRVGVDS